MQRNQHDQSRRTFLQLVAASSTAAGLGTVASAQENDEPETIELGGVSPGWVGRAPVDIEGQLNPTIELEAGRTYELTWENVDGIDHNVAIVTGGGEEVVRSEIVGEAGEMQTVEFEATEEMAEYYCEVHPDTMRGDIEIVDADPEDEIEGPAADLPIAGQFPEGETVGLEKVAEDLPALTGFEYVEGDEEDRHFVVTQTGQVYVHRPDESDAEEDTPAGQLDTDEFVFEGVTLGWEGVEPEEIDGEENPTIELEAGQDYTFTWTNQDGAPHNIAIRDEDGDTLESTDVVSEEGEAQSLAFEATEEMVDYLCEIHPSTMVGDIEIVDEPDEDPENGVEAGEPEDVPENGVEAGEDDHENPEVVATPNDMDEFLDIEDRLVNLGIAELGGYDERGLLGLAFHPDYQDNRKLYAYYSAPAEEAEAEDVPEEYDHVAKLVEFEADEDGESADPDTERTILEVPQPQDNHNGGGLEFGPEGYLYLSLGDGGNVHDIGPGHVEDWYDDNEGGNGQDTSESLLGGILRLGVDPDEDGNDVDGEGAYSIPDDNPLIDEEEQLDEYYAWGFRNPWGMSIDDDGNVITTDAGQHLIESAYDVEAGGNYGWNVKEGSFCFSPDEPLEPSEECPEEVDADADEVGEFRESEALLDPIVEYRHNRATQAFVDSAVVVGGHRYEGEELDELTNELVFANWSSEGVVDADGELLTATPPDGYWDDDGEIDADEGNQDGDGENDGDATDDENDGDATDDETEWELRELVIDRAANQSLNRYIYNVRRDEDGELYVLTNTDYRPFPNTGEIYKIVPEGDGDVIPRPDDPATVDPDEMDGEMDEGDDGDGMNDEMDGEMDEGDDGDGMNDEMDDEDGEDGEMGDGEEQ